MRYDHFTLLPELAFRPWGRGHMTLEGGGKGGSAPPPPDYTPLATSSVEAAQLGKQLGEEQLAQAKDQYNQNMAVAKPVVDAQLGLMQQAKTQGDDYYNYMVDKQRPVENALNAESLNPDTAGQAAARRGIMDLSTDQFNQNNADRALVTGSDTDVYNARQGDIEASAGRAAADARMGSAAMMNQLIRQGQRYGYSGAAMAARFAPQALNQGLGVASAMNAARQAGIDRSRTLIAQNYDMRNANTNQRINALNADRNMAIQDQAQNWGRKLDVAGLYRNLPGASQGAYGLSINAGNAAVGNQMQPSNALMTGMAQGAGMQQTGMGQRIQGQTGVLNAQSQYANTLANYETNSAAANMAGLGGLGQGLMAGYGILTKP